MMPRNKYDDPWGRKWVYERPREDGGWTAIEVFGALFWGLVLVSVVVWGVRELVNWL